MRTDQVEPIRLVDRVFHLVVGQAGREVDEDGHRVTDRDAVEVPTAKLGSLVDRDPGSIAVDISRQGHVDRTVAPGTDPPELGGALVAELGTRTTGQHRGDQFALTVEFGSPDGVDTTMNLVQTAG